MPAEQPKPDAKKYVDLIREIEKGIVKIPKFQRDFVWPVDKTADLLDSILRGYPIGTFILWQTDERLNDVKNIGNLEIHDTPEGEKVQYVLDGQQRITSLFAAYKGASMQKPGEKKITDYRKIYVNLAVDINNVSDEKIITADNTDEDGRYVSLSDVLNFNRQVQNSLSDSGFSESEIDKVFEYSDTFKTYDFSIVLLRKEDIGSAIDVFTRINTGGQTLTLFEIMSAKTYDESQEFDMEKKWADFVKELEDVKYESISSSVILNLLTLLLSETKECKRQITLSLDKQRIIDGWDGAISALKSGIGYFKTTRRVPVSGLLPYDALLVPIAYFFHENKNPPTADQRKYLEELFWRVSLSYHYTSATESKLTKDIRRVDQIIENKRPEYNDIRVDLDSPQALIDTDFRAGNSYCKAILCLLAYYEPKDFHDGGTVLLDNSSLKIATSRNYHHFFPRGHLKKTAGEGNSNSIVNITFISADANKRLIRDRPPSQYIGQFETENDQIGQTLQTHLIELDGFGIREDDYQVFLQARAKRIFEDLRSRIDLDAETS